MAGKKKASLEQAARQSLDVPAFWAGPSLPRRGQKTESQTRPSTSTSQGCKGTTDQDWSSDDLHPTPPKLKERALHSRSMSHPLSLFIGKKKKDEAPRIDDESTDDESFASKAPSPAPSTMGSRKTLRAPADLATGNCMTCGGFVRWPKELNVFRCTICLTVNDLKPHRSDRLDRLDGGKQNGGEGTTMRATRPISVEYTKSLVRGCLNSSLRHFLAVSGHDATSGLAPASARSHWPSRRPSDCVVRAATPDGISRPRPSMQTPPIHIHSPIFDNYGDFELQANGMLLNGSIMRSQSFSHPEPSPSTATATMTPHRRQEDRLDPRRVFKALEDYIVSCFGTHASLNTSFVTRTQSVSTSRRPAETARKAVAEERKYGGQDDTLVSDLDAKLLLAGDFAENGMWWTGSQREQAGAKAPARANNGAFEPSIVSSRSPRIDWGAVMEWYYTVTNAAENWTEICKEALSAQDLSLVEKQRFEASLLEAQEHVRRVILKCTEMLLKRPGQLLREPGDIRFLLIMLANPVLLPSHRGFAGYYQHSNKGKAIAWTAEFAVEGRTGSGRHSVIIKRIVGLLSHFPEQYHHYVVTWLSRLPENLFLQIKDLVNSFVAYRLRRQNDKKVEEKVDVTAGLIPKMPNHRAGNTPASLHAALESSNGSKNQTQSKAANTLAYGDDWQLKAGAKVMAFLFAANNLTHVRRNEVSVRHARGHLLATSDFYNTMLDMLDFRADFELWESKRGKFAFCQYPFLLSIGAKIQILEFDAKRQMAGKAREALFDSIMMHKRYAQHLNISVRRECLVEDSLKQVSEVVGSGTGDIKKALKIGFVGEEGVDAGGLRKEWFLLLVREVFNPDHGLFVYDDESQYCYFNPHTFETSDQYFLVGVVLGLAIYNSTILDIAFPPFAFRKLLAAAAAPAAGTTAHARPTMTYSLDDLAEYRPRLASGLRQLLDFDGDIESTFCRDFVIDVDKYGTRLSVPLCPGGESKPVTNANRREYVDLYVRYLLDTSVARQFEPFKRGFFTVCAGNALSLFRPEEIELLVRGSDEPLDVSSLRGAAVYANWGQGNAQRRPEAEPTVVWFWEAFAEAAPLKQRKLLAFITSSDRIPAMGAASITIKVHCLGPDQGRLPTAQTCYNVLNLYSYPTRDRLESALWLAVLGSEGFGLR